MSGPARPRCSAQDAVRVTFGIIVLNGEPFTTYCLRALYPFAHEIIIVEGAGPLAAGIAASDGHSRDETVARIRAFVRREDPENKVQLVFAEDHGHPDGFWPGDKDEMSRAYAGRATGNLLWQVDIDEFYHPRDMQRILTILEQDRTISGMAFHWHNFWGGFRTVADGWEYRDLMAEMGGNRRIFRWGSGYRYATHRPPTVWNDRGDDLCALGWMGADATRAMGLRCYHYGMVFSQQARQKAAYYEKMWESHTDMQRWLRDSFEALRSPFRIIHGTAPPSWLARFEGRHPPAAEALMRDCGAGAVAAGLRRADDIEQLLSSARYRLARAALRLLYPGHRLRRKAARTYRAAREAAGRLVRKKN